MRSFIFQSFNCHVTAHTIISCNQASEASVVKPVYTCRARTRAARLLGKTPSSALAQIYAGLGMALVRYK